MFFNDDDKKMLRQIFENTTTIRNRLNKEPGISDQELREMLENPEWIQNIQEAIDRLVEAVSEMCNSFEEYIDEQSERIAKPEEIEKTMTIDKPRKNSKTKNP